MARNWPHLPSYQTEQEAEIAKPTGWTVSRIEDLYEKLETGKLFDQKTCTANGTIPVVAQSAEGYTGYHSENPGVDASVENPVVTFANHTCEMRLMRRPFSVIQNVFPMRGKPGICDTTFLYYATKGRVHLQEYKGHYPDYRRLWIPLPKLAEQTRIAGILGALDDKIEHNRKMNETLEQMAKALFKSWFVDFNPVHAKAAGRQPAGMDKATADLSPDSFVESELGKIPKGWTAGSVYEISEVKYGAPFASSLFNSTGTGKPLVRIRDLADESPAVFTTEVHPKGYLLQPGDIAVGMDGEFRAYLWAGIESWLNQRVCVFAPKEGFSAAFVRNSIMGPLSEVESTETATTVIHLGKNDIDRFKVVIPNTEIAKAFGHLCQPWYDQIVANKEQSRTLSSLRDSLLPKLLNGESPIKAHQ